MHPDEVLAELLKSAGTRKKRTLEAIHATCREQHERDAKDFSLPTIARLGKARGGPVVGTIRNKTGADYQALIKAWANHAGGVPRKMPRVKDNPVMDLVQKIDDPATRSIMAGVLAENRKLRGEVNLLKHEIRKSTYLDLRERGKAADHTAQVVPETARLLPSEIGAFRYAISEEKIIDEGWVIDKHGRVCNNKGRVIFPVGFMTGLQKLINDAND